MPVVKIPINTVYPEDQEIFIDPYNGKLFDFDNYQSRVYLGRTINQLLRVFGDNCIIDRLKISDVNYIKYEDGKEELIVQISPGKVIIDTTLIEFPSDTILTFDSDSFSSIPDNIDTFIVSVAYNYLLNRYENKARFRLTYIDSNNNSPNFYTEFDKIILTQIKLNRELGLFELIPSYYLNPNFVFVNGKSYKVFPADHITNNIINVVKELFY